MLQKGLVKEWDEIEEEGKFFTAWLLLEDAERKRHLLKGLEEASILSLWSQDARAMCPEITLSFMLRQRGKALIDFIGDYRSGKKEAGEDNVYFLPNGWWQKAADLSEPLPEVEFRIVSSALCCSCVLSFKLGVEGDNKYIDLSVRAYTGLFCFYHINNSLLLVLMLTLI